MPIWEAPVVVVDLPLGGSFLSKAPTVSVPSPRLVKRKRQWRTRRPKPDLWRPRRCCVSLGFLPKCSGTPSPHTPTAFMFMTIMIPCFVYGKPAAILPCVTWAACMVFQFQPCMNMVFAQKLTCLISIQRECQLTSSQKPLWSPKERNFVELARTSMFYHPPLIPPLSDGGDLAFYTLVNAAIRMA